MKKAAFSLLVFALVLTPLVRGHAQQAGPVPQAVQPALAASATQPAPPPAPQATQKPTPPPAPALSAPTPTQAPPPRAANVRLDVTINDQGGAKTPAITKTMSIVVNRNGSLRSGVNVPLPYTVFASEKGAQPQGTPVTSYNYRNMGLSLDVINLYVDRAAGLIHVRMSLEYNPIDEADKAGAAPGMPVSYSNFSQAFELDLENGKPLLVAQTSDPVPSRNRTLTVVVMATIVKSGRSSPPPPLLSAQIVTTLSDACMLTACG